MTRDEQLIESAAKAMFAYMSPHLPWDAAGDEIRNAIRECAEAAIADYRHMTKPAPPMPVLTIGPRMSAEEEAKLTWVPIAVDQDMYNYLNMLDTDAPERDTD